MTSQVAVFNQIGIAISSDTILTVSHNSGAHRTYENRSKIVSLEHPHKVVVAHHGKAMMNGVDIHLLLRTWSRSLVEPLDELQDYVNSFRDWFNSSNGLISVESETELAVDLLYDGFQWLNDRVRYARDGSSSKKSVEEEPLLNHAAWLLGAYQDLTVLDGFSDDNAKDYIKQTGVDVDAIIMNVFDSRWKHLKDDLMLAYPTLIEVAPLMLSRRDRTLSHTGMAFAGYGAAEHFPSVVEIKMHGRIGNGTLLWTEDVQKEPPGILSFATDDAVQGFLWGASKSALNILVMLLQTSLWKQVRSEQLDSTVAENIESEWQGGIWEELGKRFKAPLDATVASLALFDLARFSKSLVEIESLRSNASPRPPGVGGLIETVVVDGLEGVRWVSRLQGPSTP